MPARNGAWNADGSAEAIAPHRAASRNALNVVASSTPSAGLDSSACGRISVPGSASQTRVSGSGRPLSSIGTSRTALVDLRASYRQRIRRQARRMDRQIQLVDHVDHELGEVILRQPLAHVGVPLRNVALTDK